MTLLKEVLEDLNKGKTFYAHGSQDFISLLKWQYSPNLSTDSMSFLLESQLTSLWKLKS